MKVLEKAILKNGVQIQLEDWRDKNTAEYHTLYGLVIAAYPIAERSDGWIHGGQKFRLDIGYNQYANYTNEMVLSDYRALVNAEKQQRKLAVSGSFKSVMLRQEEVLIDNGKDYVSIDSPLYSFERDTSGKITRKDY